MEGVVVRARKAGATMTVSVVSDAQGRNSFPGGSSGRRTIHAVDSGPQAYMLAGPALVTHRRTDKTPLLTSSCAGPQSTKLLRN